MVKLDVNEESSKKKSIPLIMAIAGMIIDQLRFVERINEAVKWDRSHWFISPGVLLKMLVLATFTDIRVPLTHLAERFEDIDTKFFLDPEDKAEHINEYNVGEAMDRLAEVDYYGLYESIALTAVQEYNVPIQRMHSDTTTLSFYGEYNIDEMSMTEEEIEKVLRIEPGYNKDGRPGCNQVVVGQIVNELGIPIVNKVQSGSTSDIDWNRESIKYMESLRDRGFKTGLYVADSKLMIAEHVTRMNTPESRIDFVSRCPANFNNKQESRMIQAAYAKGEFTTYGPYGSAKDAAIYRGIGFTEEVFGQPMRFIVLESSSLLDSGVRAFEKKEAEIKPLIRELTEKSFKCQADAEAEYERFKKKSQMKLFECVHTVVKREEEKWPRGRRGKQTKPIIQESYHIQIEKINKNEEEYQRFIQNESCIVLASNALHMSDEDIVKAYKGQYIVENSFRALKSPQLASVIYLKNRERIQVLSMLLTFSLLIRALIQFKMRQGLETFREQNPDTPVRAGWKGRELQAPTFKLLYEHTINCCYEREGSGSYSYSWPSKKTKEKVAPLLNLLGYTLGQLLQ